MKGGLIVAGILAALMVPGLSFAAVIIEQPISTATEHIYGDIPMIFSGSSGRTPWLMSTFSATGTVRTIKIRYNMTRWDNPVGVQVYLHECPLLATDTLKLCNDINARDSSLGWDGTFIHPPISNNGELTIDFTSAGTYNGSVDFTDGVTLDPTRGYRLEVKFISNSFDVDVLGAWGSGGGFYPYFKLEGDVPTSTSATSTPPICNENCNSNVMFLPGVGGSRLYRPARVDEAPLTEVRMWEPRDDVDVLNLGLNEQGKQEFTSPQSEIYTRDVLDEAYVNHAGPNIYKSFMIAMDELVASSSIAQWSAVPYDWRLSLDDIISSGVETDGKISYVHPSQTPFVMSELIRLASTSRTGKVTVVAHSNGGLVIKALLVAHPELERHVDKMIFVAVPQVGTPQAIAAILHGNKQGIPTDYAPLIMSAQAGRQFSVNAPVAYNLLPSSSYFTYVDDAVVTFDSDTLSDWSDKYGSVIHSEETLDAFLTDSYERVPKDSTNTTMPIQANDFLLTHAQAMHASLDAWTPSQDIEVIQIAGWGIPTTLKGIDYSSTTPSVFCQGVCEGGMTYAARNTVDGDGTVVTPSALWMSTTTGVMNYWVDVQAFNRDQSRLTQRLRPYSHKDILEIPSLDNFISDIVSNSTNSPFRYQYMSEEAPSSTGRRLRYALHSPLSIDIYDSFGRHTGISTTTGEIEEQIPGTYYAEFGEVKYLFTDASTSARVVLDGYDTGTFTLEVSELQDDTLIASTTFKDMPTTPDTIATIDVASNISTLTPLAIDLNGDGIIEHTLLPKLNDVVTLPRPKLTFNAENQTIVLGSAPPSFTGFFTGFEGTDTATNTTTGSPICTTTAPITTVGTYPITCTQGSLASEKYDFETFVPGTLKVIYHWSGFLQPIDDLVANPSDTPSVFKAGSTVPVKLQLKAASGQTLQASTSPIWLPPQKGSALNSSIDESIYSAPGTTGNTFKWDPATSQYQYNWKTDKSQTGNWYKIFVKLDDGTIKSVVVGVK